MSSFFNFEIVLTIIDFIQLEFRSYANESFVTNKDNVMVLVFLLIIIIVNEETSVKTLTQTDKGSIKF